MSTNPQELALPIIGMTCASCVSHVELALNKVEGVANANVNLATERAIVQFANGGVEAETLMSAVRDAG